MQHLVKVKVNMKCHPVRTRLGRKLFYNYSWLRNTHKAAKIQIGENPSSCSQQMCNSVGTLLACAFTLFKNMDSHSEKDSMIRDASEPTSLVGDLVESPQEIE